MPADGCCRSDHEARIIASPASHADLARAIHGAQSVEDLQMSVLLPFWQRLLITTVAVLIASWVAGLIWQEIFNFPLPSYAAGVIGGLTALPLWDFLKRVRPSVA
jgi:hypothetical protein